MQNLELNPNVEYILGADISMSMETIDPLCGGQTRYNYMLEKFQSFIKTAEDFDEHGAPTIILFGENVKIYEHVKLDDIRSKLNSIVFEGFTNLHLLIEEAYKLHREDKSELAKEKKFHPGTKLLVFTDGEPTNKPAVERIIARIANEIDTQEEFQIMFLTVGTISPGLQRWLDGLHDKMEDKIINPRDFDIIHISPLEKISFLGAVGANKHD